MIIVPIFAIFVVQALRDHTSLFPPAQKSKSRADARCTIEWEERAKRTSFPPSSATNSPAVRTFVAILLSGTPAAANQLVVTQLYNPAGTADTLASFLLLQCGYHLFVCRDGAGKLTLACRSFTDALMFVLSTYVSVHLPLFSLVDR